MEIDRLPTEQILKERILLLKSEISEIEQEIDRLDNTGQALSPLFTLMEQKRTSLDMLTNFARRFCPLI